jgi:hypothetical protein
MTPKPTEDASAATDSDDRARTDGAPTPAEGGRTPRRQRSDVSRTSRNNSTVKRRGRYGDDDDGDNDAGDDAYYGYYRGVASDDEEMTTQSRQGRGVRSVSRNGSARRQRSASSAPREAADEDRDVEPASPASKSNAAYAPTNSSVVSTTRVLVLPRAPASKSNVNEPPPTDVEDTDGWEWVAAEKMYWNDASGLYLDPDTGLFYHPDSALWYDGTLELWYDQQGNPVATGEEGEE